MCGCFETRLQECEQKLKQSDPSVTDIGVRWRDEALNFDASQKGLTIEAVAKTQAAKIIKESYFAAFDFCPFCGANLTHSDVATDDALEARIKEMLELYANKRPEFAIEDLIAIQTIAQEVRTRSPQRFAQIAGFDSEGYGDFAVSMDGTIELVKNGEKVSLPLQECIQTLSLPETEYTDAVAGVLIYNQKALKELMQEADNDTLEKIERVEDVLENKFKYITVSSIEEMMNITQEEMHSVNIKFPIERFDEEEKIVITAKGYLEDHSLELYLDYDLEDEGAEKIFYTVNIF